MANPSDNSDTAIPTPRPENDILMDLETLCTSPGYIHALAFLSWENNFISYRGSGLKPDDLSRMHRPDRLLRTEISLLTGLMVKQAINTELPAPKIMQDYIDETKKRLEELHNAIIFPMVSHIIGLELNTKIDNPFSQGKILREPIFYSAESAYSFQYRDFAENRYYHDKDWFEINMGFLPAHIKSINDSISEIQLSKMERLRAEFKIGEIQSLTLLRPLIFTIEELIEKTHYPYDIIKAIVSAFSLKTIPCNSAFLEIGSFNEINACPIIHISDTEYLLLQGYSLAESSYESPFFWMGKDKGYSERAKENRGLFTENFSHRRLCSVFGEHRVYENVTIMDGKNRKGEIDVLVVFADRAIILQAKSKKLTFAARSGDDIALRTDFQKAVQDAYDQGFKCAEFLADKTYELIDKNSKPIEVRRDFAEVFVVCVVAENYPALALQAEQFLVWNTHGTIKPPYVIDVFLLDVLCEFLVQPYQFLNYLHRRLHYINKINSSNEWAVLAYHIRHNLWVEENIDFLYIDDGVAVDLDASMTVRREGISGRRTPEGILTKFKGTIFEQIVEQIGEREQDRLLDLIYFLLALSESAVKEINKALRLLLDKTSRDGQTHDFSIEMGAAGITFHSTKFVSEAISERFIGHCQLAKYRKKADRWFGLILSPSDKSLVRKCLSLNFPWKKSDQMDSALKYLPKKNHRTVSAALQRDKALSKKPGRNESCRCGSGKKYKKCCLIRN